MRSPAPARKDSRETKDRSPHVDQTRTQANPRRLAWSANLAHACGTVANRAALAESEERTTVKISEAHVGLRVKRTDFHGRVSLGTIVRIADQTKRPGVIVVKVDGVRRNQHWHVENWEPAET